MQGDDVRESFTKARVLMRFRRKGEGIEQHATYKENIPVRPIESIENAGGSHFRRRTHVTGIEGDSTIITRAILRVLTIADIFLTETSEHWPLYERWRNFVSALLILMKASYPRSCASESVWSVR